MSRSGRGGPRHDLLARLTSFIGRAGVVRGRAAPRRHRLLRRRLANFPGRRAARRSGLQLAGRDGRFRGPVGPSWGDPRPWGRAHLGPRVKPGLRTPAETKEAWPWRQEFATKT